ncbi:MAG: NusG domain II-containing protein [Ruminiclostridium sp.]|nr:NusG domain II-containing protein [Ruminiclostridium sp.]
MPTHYDKILVAIVLIASLVSYGIFALQNRKSPDDIIVVRQNGAVIFKLTQEEMKKDGIYDFEFDGGIGYLEIKDEKARLLPMERSICPEAICSNTGWIDGNPKIIVCVPNRLVVSFIKDKNSEPDGIAF